jgi:hypothetical protein
VFDVGGFDGRLGAVYAWFHLFGRLALRCQWGEGVVVCVFRARHCCASGCDNDCTLGRILSK